MSRCDHDRQTVPDDRLLPCAVPGCPAGLVSSRLTVAMLPTLAFADGEAVDATVGPDVRTYERLHAWWRDDADLPHFTAWFWVRSS